MRPNRLRPLFRDGGFAVNGWLQIASSVSAEALSQTGFDSLTLDLQHGPIDFGQALAMLQAISIGDCVPLCRVPWNEPGVIMRMLDAGCYGVICPMIGSRDEAEAFVGACRYPPDGYRSFGPTRARLYAGADYAEHANRDVLAFAMIETRGGLDHLEAILDVPGLDGVYVGPADLSQALGGPPGSDWQDGPVPAALERIVAATRERGLVAGLHTASPAYARHAIELGYRFVTVQSDLAYLTAGARAAIAGVRDGNGAAGGGTPPAGPY